MILGSTVPRRLRLVKDKTRISPRVADLLDLQDWAAIAKLHPRTGSKQGRVVMIDGWWAWLKNDREALLIRPVCQRYILEDDGSNDPIPEIPHGRRARQRTPTPPRDLVPEVKLPEPDSEGFTFGPTLDALQSESSYSDTSRPGPEKIPPPPMPGAPLGAAVITGHNLERFFFQVAGAAVVRPILRTPGNDADLIPDYSWLLELPPEGFPISPELASPEVLTLPPPSAKSAPTYTFPFPIDFPADQVFAYATGIVRNLLPSFSNTTYAEQPGALRIIIQDFIGFAFFHYYRTQAPKDNPSRALILNYCGSKEVLSHIDFYLFRDFYKTVTKEHAAAIDLMLYAHSSYNDDFEPSEETFTKFYGAYVDARDRRIHLQERLVKAVHRHSFTTPIEELASWIAADPDAYFLLDDHPDRIPPSTDNSVTESD